MCVTERSIYANVNKLWAKTNSIGWVNVGCLKKQLFIVCWDCLEKIVLLCYYTITPLNWRAPPSTSKISWSLSSQYEGCNGAHFFD